MDAGQLVWIIGSWTIGVCIAAVAGIALYLIGWCVSYARVPRD